MNVVWMILLLSLGQVVPPIPHGSPPVVDGHLLPGEWDDALRLPFYGGDHIVLKRDDEDLFIGIRGAAGGFASLGLASGDTLRILHASTGLITAAYFRGVEGWERLHGFLTPTSDDGSAFSRSDVRLTAEYQEAAYEQFGWTANVVELGRPSDFEFRVRLPEGRPAQRLSVVLFQARATHRVARAPEGLNDASLDTDLIQGSAADRLEFDPESWLPIR